MAVSQFKTYAAGEVLTASDLNSSLLQLTDNGEDLAWQVLRPGFEDVQFAPGHRLGGAVVARHLERQKAPGIEADHHEDADQHHDDDHQHLSEGKPSAHS